MEYKIKHLEFIQNNIIRMSTNSFIIKGWAITLIVALLSIENQLKLSINLIIPFSTILFFWYLNAYFLQKERQFRVLYNKVRKLSNDEIDFAMNVADCNDNSTKFIKVFLSETLIIIYLPLTILILFKLLIL